MKIPKKACIWARMRAGMMAFAGVLVLVFGLSAPALAHGTSARLFYDNHWVGHGGVTASHHFVYACDDREDGNAIYTVFDYTGDRGHNARVYDANGSKSGCTQLQIGATITRYKVCMVLPVVVDPCTPWTDPA